MSWRVLATRNSRSHSLRFHPKSSTIEETMLSSTLVRQVLRIRSKAIIVSRHRASNKLVTAPQSTTAVHSAGFSSWVDKIAGGVTANNEASSSSTSAGAISSSAALDDVKVEKVRVAACGDIDSDDEDEDDEMEQEEMFVEAYASPSFEHGVAEWGGPRRGGRLPEPTRFGDWERKGRCSDF